MCKGCKVTDVETATIERNRAQQTDWYGETVGEVVRRVTSGLQLSQAELSSVIGLSPPMLSQLASGRRAKIANPAVLGRLQALAELTASPELGTLPRAEVARRVAEVRSRDATGVLTGTGTLEPRGGGAVSALLRALVPVAQAEARATALEATQPELAVLLRTYLLGTAEQAAEHYARTVGSAGAAR